MASDIFGVFGRDMMNALITGQRDLKILAVMARSRVRLKIGWLEEAFAGLSLGIFDDRHRFLLGTMLARIDAVSADIAALDTEIGDRLAPFADAVDRLDEVPGIGSAAAAVIIAEIGLDMTRFPTSKPFHRLGEVRPPGSTLQRARPRAVAAPATGTITWPGCSVRRR